MVSTGRHGRRDGPRAIRMEHAYQIEWLVVHTPRGGEALGVQILALRAC